MGWTGGPLAVRGLVASVALLLPAGVLAATVTDPSGSSVTVEAGRPAGEAAPAQPAVPDLPTTTSTALVTVDSPPTPSTTTTTTGRATTPTTRTAPTTAPTTASSRPRVPPRPGPVFPTIPAASSWQAEQNGIRARMRIEPASPVAGQAVRFLIDVSSSDPCCVIQLDFGDGAKFSVNAGGGTCAGDSPFSPGPHSYATTHAYANPWTYRVQLGVISGDLCPQPTVPPGPSSAPISRSASLSGCISVGPPTTGQPAHCQLPGRA